MAGLQPRPSFSRSRSSSCIPVRQKDFRNTSSKTSASKDRNPQSRFTEISYLQRSNSALSLGSRSTLSVGVRCTSTPLNSNSRTSRSPFRTTSSKKENRFITDKKWQQDQLIMVRKFVDENRGVFEVDPMNIKSGLSLDCFIQTMSAAAKELDSRITFTRENYIDEIPRFLRLYRYPTSIKGSLMKTANVPHSWPQILGILSWIIDFIKKNRNTEEQIYYPTLDLGKPETHLVLLSFISNSFQLWNAQENESVAEDTLTEKFGTLLGIDMMVLEENENEIKALTVKRDKYKEKLSNIDAEVDTMEKSIHTMTTECETYLNEFSKFREEVQKKHELLYGKLKEFDGQLGGLTARTDQLKKIIDNQPYNVKQKQQLEQEVDELKHTLMLKKERYEEQMELISSFDMQMADTKKQIETEAYKYNNKIRQLALLKPELQSLLIRETGFIRSDASDEIGQVIQMKNDLKTQVQSDVKEVDIKLNALTEKEHKLTAECKMLRANIKKSELLEFERNSQLKSLTETSDKEIMALCDKLTGLEQSKIILEKGDCDVNKYHLELMNVMKEYEKLKNTKQQNHENAIYFFTELQKHIGTNLLEYAKIAEEVITKGLEVYGYLTEQQQILLQKIQQFKVENEEFIKNLSFEL